MAHKETEENCFTYLWKLENISYSLQKKGSSIISPAFVVDAIEGTKWRLWLYPRGSEDANCIGCFLHREADSKGSGRIEIRYELAFTSKDGSILASYGSTKDEFSKGKGFGYDEFAKRECVYISRRSEFLPQDTLTIRCKMWNSLFKMTERVHCTARTNIEVEKRSFQWNVKSFSNLKLEEKCSYLLKAMENDSPILSISLRLIGILSSEEIISFNLLIQDKSIKFCTFLLFLVDDSGNRVKCNQDEIWLDGPDKCYQFTLSFTKKDFQAKKSIYLPDDTLKLFWECAFSKGVVTNKIEDTQLDSNSSDLLAESLEKKLHLANSEFNTLSSLYDKQFLCDVNLKTTKSVFPAHKVILSASSDVFSAMFSNDMKEKMNDCVNIEDISDDTIRRMLLYMYSSRMEDITWESATHVYVAADKYAILGLKNICTSYLKENLSSRNACEVLMLSDFHADDNLKETVQNFILKHGKDIVNSDEWKLLMETNGKLAAETLCLRYK